MTPSEPQDNELNPFEVPPDEQESIEGKVALEAIPSMRRWTGYEHAAMPVPRSPWVQVAWILGVGFAVGAAVVLALRVL